MSKQLCIRVSDELLARIDALVEQPPASVTLRGKPTRTLLLKELILAGLAALEQEPIAEPDLPVPAELYARIVELRDAGLSPSAVGQELAAKGIRNAAGKPYSARAVRAAERQARRQHGT